MSDEPAHNSVANSMQCSRTPYNHLRRDYPETWKNLMRIWEKNAPPTKLNGKVDGQEGLTLAGPQLHPCPSESESKSPKIVLSPEQKETLKKKKAEEASMVHQLNLLKNTKRNPTGGWYEGLPTGHKISQDYTGRCDKLYLQESEKSKFVLKK